MLTMHVSCEMALRQHKDFDFNVNVSSDEQLFVKQLLSVNKDVRDRWSALRYHHHALYERIRQKASDMLEEACGKDVYQDKMVSWSPELLAAI